MKPTKKQLAEFPAVVNLVDSEGNDCGNIPGNVLWDFMVENGYKKMDKKEIQKAANQLLLIMIDKILDKKLTKTKKTVKTKAARNKKATKSKK